MTKTNGTDPRDALRGCLIHIKQTGEAIATAEAQRSDAVSVGDLASVRRATKHLADLRSDLDALTEGRKLLEAKVVELDSADRIKAVDAAIEQIRPQIEEVIVAV